MTFVVTFLLQCDQLNLVGKQVVGRKQKFKMASKCLPLLCSSIPPFRASCSPRDPEPLGCNFIPCFSALVVGCSQRMLLPKAEESGLFLTCAFRLILKMLKSASDLLYSSVGFKWGKDCGANSPSLEICQVVPGGRRVGEKERREKWVRMC